MRREYELAQYNAEQLVAQALEHGLPQFVRFGKGHLGQALIGLGNLDDGIVQLREVIGEKQSVEAAMLLPSQLGCLSDGLTMAGRLDEADDTIADALTLIEQTGERWSEAELHRLKGELALRKSAKENADAAEACFLKSLDIARDQSAKWWELRTAISLTRFWCDQGKRKEARNLLAPVYGWFTEGFDTVDLMEAKARLNELQ